MKYLKLNAPEDTVETEFGKYIYYNESTDKMTKQFAYEIIGIEDLCQVYSGMRTIAENYLESLTSEQKVGKTPDLLLAQYGRSEAYNTDTWNIVGGQVDQNLVSLLYDSYFYFPKIKTIVLNNKDTIKAQHFWATVNAYYTGHGDLGGWAGDIVDFAKEIKDGSEMAFPESSGFSADQWRADSDAYNIYTISSSNFLDSMKNYYGTAGYVTEKTRIDSFIEGGDNMVTRFTTSPDYTTKLPIVNQSYLELLMATDGVTMDNVNIALSRMQDYINK